MAVQAGKDLLVKVDMSTDGNFETIAGLRATRLSFNAEAVDVTALDSQGGWRELLTGVEARNSGGAQGDANELLDTLGRNGVSLSVVKASDLRRIASASSQGELQRRRAIRDTAPGEIQRVSQLLDRDIDLQRSARTFLAVEGPQALRALATAETAREDAEPRLSAYLLLDAALSASS